MRKSTNHIYFTVLLQHYISLYYVFEYVFHYCSRYPKELIISIRKIRKNSSHNASYDKGKTAL